VGGGEDRSAQMAVPPRQSGRERKIVQRFWEDL
jgi:hypothetical protein